MNETHRRRVDALLSEALAVDDDERAVFLDQHCGAERALRADVDELLRLAFQPAPGLQPGVLATELLPVALAEAIPPGELQEGQQVGAWRVLREVGRGGMGAVYLVERVDDQFRQRGALKLVRSLVDSDEIAPRLQRERRILAALTHPGIARLLDGGQTDDGRPFLVMEFVDGKPLDRYCDEEQLTIAARLDVFMRVCEAVHYAHRQLVVHRDVKPSNIVVTTDGDPKLLDFGIARLLSPTEAGEDVPLTRPMVRVLTPEYASPEQVRGEPVATASDVYQLGLLLYELLTGHRAQAVLDSTAAALDRAVCETPPVRPSARAALAALEVSAARGSTRRGLVRALAGDLDTIVLCALRKEPDRRYASVAELLDDVRRYRAGLPLRARQDTWSYRARKFVTRHRAAAGWVAAALVAAALVLPSWAQQRSLAAREAERAQQVERIIEALFAFPHPRVRSEPPLAVRYIDYAASLVRRELSGQPESQGRLLTLLGRLYNALGHYETSIETLEQALALRRDSFGPESIETADTLEWLGQSQHYSGRYGAARASVERALAIRQRSLGPSGPDTIRTAIELGDLLHTGGDLVAAERTLREVLRTLRTEGLTVRVQELGHDSLPRAIRDLANVLRDRGLLDESAALYQEAISMFRQLDGGHDQQVTISEIYFAHLLIAQAKFDEAEVLLTRSIPVLRRIYDGDHALIGMALRTFGHLRIEQGRLQEAGALLEEAQDIQRQWLGPDHAMVARATVHQAELARRFGRLADAVSLARQALDAFDRLGLTDHPSAIAGRRTLGEGLLALGDRDAARRVLTSGLTSAERQFAAGDARIVRLRAALARSATTGGLGSGLRLLTFGVRSDR